MKYISAWRIYTGNLRGIIAQAVQDGEIETSDIVWRGPSGDVVVAPTAADLDEDYVEFVDSGQIGEYLDE